MPSADGSKHVQEGNSKAIGTFLDENADATKPQSTTGTAAKGPLKNPIRNKSLQQKPLPSLTSTINPLIDSGAQRTMLNDKSNRGGRTLPVFKDKGKEKAIIEPLHYPPLESDPIQEKSGLQAPAAVIATNTSSPLAQPSEQQKQQSASYTSKLDTTDTTANTETAALVEPSTEATSSAKAAEAAIKDFFNDNKKRYKSSSVYDQPPSPMQPTPIIPIIVPDRMKPLLREKYLGGTSSSSSIGTITITSGSGSDKKRSYDVVDGQDESLLATRKSKKQQNDCDSKGKTIVDSETIAAMSPSLSSLNFSSQQPIPSFSALEARKNKPSSSSSSSISASTSTILVSQHILNQVRELEDQQDQHAQQQLLKTNTTLRYQDDPATQDSMKDPMLVANYADEIHAYLRATEGDTMVDPNYMEIQDEVTWRMRDVLVDWMADIHYHFHLLPETFFLAVNIIDRFLAKRPVSLASLQLLGITALFVASKFEQILSPPMHHYLYMTANSVTEEELLKAERYLLKVLDFKLCHPHPLHFLRRCTMTGQFDLRLRILAKYLMEIAYIDHRFLGTPPSLVAASALWLALKISGERTWTPELDELTGYTVADLKATVDLIMDYISQPIGNSRFFKKWASRRMLKVSIYVRDWVERFHTE